LASPKFWAGYAIACNHFHTDGPHLSRHVPPMFLSISLFTQQFLICCSIFHWQKASHNARPPDRREIQWKALSSNLYCVANNIIVLLLCR